MSDRRVDMADEGTLVVGFGGMEVVIKAEMGVLSVNATAPGEIDGSVFTLDEDGDAKVAFFANGRHALRTDVHQGPGAVVKACQYSPQHKLDGVLAVTTIDCGPVGVVHACQACADFYETMGGSPR